jgi:Heterokaryon incompatibility protein (HET)
MPEYKYGPLLHEDSLRLLILEPGSKGKPICCRLTHSRLGLYPQYNAVSYVWGDNSNNHKICIDNCSLEIQHNLYVALQHFRDENQPRILWVDAICLNQADVVERNHQVKLMRRIYEGSELTLIWFGVAKAEELLALNVCLRYDHALRMSYMLSHDLSWNRRFSIAREFLRNRPEANHNSIDQMKSFKAIDLRAWSRRIWVLQEYAVSENAIIIYGRTSFQSQALALAMQDMLPSFGKLLSISGVEEWRKVAMLRLELFNRIRLNYTRGKQVKLQELLYATYGYFEASDPRDHVFALIGLVGGEEYQDLVDYELTTREVFTQTMERCLLEDGSPFPLLSLVGSAPPSEFRDSLPSWVPDFSFCGYIRSSFSVFSPFSAAGDSQPVVSVIGNTLSLVGNIVDTVHQVLHCPTVCGRLDWNIMQPWYRRCRNLIYENQICYTGYTANSTWWRVMVCDLHSAWNSTYSAWSSGTFTWQRASIGFGAQFLKEGICAPCWNDREPFSSNPTLREAQIQYRDIVSRTSGGMDFCSTDGGRIGWIPRGTQVGDKICIFSGSKAPFIVRKMQDECYKLIGDAYIHGFMYGKDLDRDIIEWEDIQLR